MLLIGVVLIVLIFRSSGALAAAYGIAVTGVMVIDTFHVSLVAARQWHWGVKLAIARLRRARPDRRDDAARRTCSRSRKAAGCRSPSPPACSW